MKSNGVWWSSRDFKYKISWNPMGSDEVHEILSIKSHVQWDLMKFMSTNGVWWNSWDFKYKILWNPMGSDEIYEGFKYKIFWNPMGSDEIYEGFKYKSYEMQWDLMKFMRF